MGSLFGGLLAESGERVWLFDPIFVEHVAHIRSDGLVIEEQGEQRTVRVNATAEIGGVGVADLLVIFVKAPDTEAAVQGALPAIGDRTRVLSLQNGLGIVETIEKQIDRDRILRGTTAHGATLLGPGLIRHAGRGPTAIGTATGDRDGRLDKIIDVFNRADIETYYVQDTHRLVWEKLLINLAINPLTAIFDVANGKLISDNELNRIMHHVVREGIQVAQAEGLNISFQETIEQVEQVCRNTAENFSSMLQDVRRKGQTEIEFINGAVVNRGDRLEIETPLNRLLIKLVTTSSPKRRS